MEVPLLRTFRIPLCRVLKWRCCLLKQAMDSSLYPVSSEFSDDLFYWNRC